MEYTKRRINNCRVSIPGHLTPRGAQRSRTVADLRTLTTAIWEYYVDNKSLPQSVPIASYAEGNDYQNIPGHQHQRTIFPGNETVAGVTTPVAYIVELPLDKLANNAPYSYFAKDDQFIIYSPGLDKQYDILDAATEEEAVEKLIPFTYDPTNGTFSNGDIWRLNQ